MTQLTITGDTDADQARRLIEQQIEIGDTVEITNAERTEDHQMDVTGEVTGFEPGYIEIDGQSPEEGSVRYDEIQTVEKLESE